MLLISYIFLFTLKTPAYYTVYIHIIKTQSESFISLCSVWNKEFMLICIASYKHNFFKVSLRIFVRFVLYASEFSVVIVQYFTQHLLEISLCSIVKF